ncbi:MAG: SLC13 family permease [Candidatus Omnitrophota bacterium]
MIKKFFLLIGISVCTGFLSKAGGFNSHQALAISIFLVSVLGTLLFWEFRLAFVFLGSSALLLTNTINLESLIKFASLDVILFLVGMMVLVALLKETGLFAWIVSLILRIRNLTANKFLVVICFISAVLSAMTSEVVSIIFMVAAILEICDYFEVDPVPFIIISVFATNIGSAATVLGNPIGILIATKAGLTFEDFIIKAFPISVVCLIAVIFIFKFWYRKNLAQLDEKIKELGANEILIKLISVPIERQLRIALFIFGVTLFFIALHHRLEILLHLESNTILLTIPLISAGVVMLWKWQRAREFIEKDVEWWTLLFFMLLFAQAGALHYTGATDTAAGYLAKVSGNNPVNLLVLIISVSAIGSSILDNVVLVTAFIPVIQSFKNIGFNLQPLWWALLFGGCLGGNITLVGSTANIVALGILEKERNIKLTFFRWFWIGLTVGIISIIITALILIIFPIYHV